MLTPGWTPLFRPTSLCLLGGLDGRVQTAPEVDKRKDQQSNSHAGRTGVVGLGLRDEARVLVVAEGMDTNSRHALNIGQTGALVVDHELEHSVLVGQLQGGGEGADSRLVIHLELFKGLANIGIQHDQLELNIVGRERVPLALTVLGQRDRVRLITFTEQRLITLIICRPEDPTSRSIEYNENAPCCP